MKPFDLEAAKAGAPLITREGNPARIVCFDAQSETHPLLALVKVSGTPDYELATFVTEQGEARKDSMTNSDLFMAPIKHEGWIYLHKHGARISCYSGVYATKEEAEASARLAGYLAIVAKVEWEE